MSISRKDIGKWTKLRTYSIHPYNNRIVCNRRENNIYFRNSDTILLRFDRPTKSQSVPTKCIDQLLAKDGIKRVQIIWTNKIPTTSEYENACELASRRGLSKPVVDYDENLIKLLNFGSLQKEIEKLPKVTRTRKQRSKNINDNIDGYNIFSDYNGFKIKSKSFKIKEGGIYVSVDYKSKTCKTNGKILTTNALNALQRFLGPDQKICGFTQFRIDKIKKKKLDTIWISLYDAVKEKVEEYLSKEKITVDKLLESREQSNWLCNLHFSNIQSWIINSNLNNDHIIIQYLEKSNELNAFNNKHFSIVEVINYLGIKCIPEIPSIYNVDNNKQSNCELAILYKKIDDKYKLLKFIRNSYSLECKEAITDYIKTIDENFKLKENTKNTTNN